MGWTKTRIDLRLECRIEVVAKSELGIGILEGRDDLQLKHVMGDELCQSAETQQFVRQWSSQRRCHEFRHRGADH